MITRRSVLGLIATGVAAASLRPLSTLLSQEENIVRNDEMPDSSLERLSSFARFCKQQYGLQERVQTQTIDPYYRVVQAPDVATRKLLVFGEGLESIKVASLDEIADLFSDEHVYVRRVAANAKGLSQNAFEKRPNALYTDAANREHIFLKTYAHEGFHTLFNLDSCVEEALVTACGICAVSEYAKNAAHPRDVFSLMHFSKGRLDDGIARSHIHTQNTTRLLEGDTRAYDATARALNELYETNAFVSKNFSLDEFAQGDRFVNNAYLAKENRYWLLFDQAQQVIQQEGLQRASDFFQSLPKDPVHAAHLLAKRANKATHPLYVA